MITRTNIDTMIDSRQIQVLMKNGNWWEIRRNGRTQKWARDPNRIRIPFKAGMYCYGAITESDFDSAGQLDQVNYRVKP